MQGIVNLIDWILPRVSCIFKEKYHLYCPGCGATRALKHLAKFELWASLCSNPCVILLILAFFTIAALFVFEQYKWKGKKRLYKARVVILGGTLIVWMAFFIIRNLLLKYAGIDYLGDLL